MRACLKQLLVALVIALVLLTVAVKSAPRWLPSISGFLITEDPLAPSDLIVVLSGSVPDRPRYAAVLYQRGLAPRLLCASSMVPEYLQVAGPSLTHAELSATVLLKMNIPEKDILVLNQSTSTFEELIIVRDLMLERKWKRVILVSSPYHLRRIRLTWNHLSEETSLEAIVRGTPYARFHRDTWWRYEGDLLSVQNEYAKIAYYELFLFRDKSPVEPY